MRALAWSAGAAAGLVAVYLALGGASYAPAKAADPCAALDWTEPDGIQEVGEQIVLSALDGAACELEVSREEIVLAFEDRRTLEQFARDHDVSERRVEELVKVGFERAVDDAERAGALNARFADALREAFSYIPAGDVIELLETFVR